MSPLPHSLPWYYADNGFSALGRMHEAHRPLVSLARMNLAKSTGAVLDLGCGNGVLLRKICARRNGLVPYGIDCSPAAIAHARMILPTASAHFVHDDMFAAHDWIGERRYELAVLMAGRLLEVSRASADWLLDVLYARCQRILVYVYPGAGKNLIDLSAKARLDLLSVHGYAGMLRVPSRPHRATLSHRS